MRQHHIQIPLVLLAILFGLNSFFLAMPVAKAASFNPNNFYILQEQIVAMPAKNAQQVLLVDTITLYNGTNAIRNIQMPLVQGVLQAKLLRASAASVRLVHQRIEAAVKPGNTSFAIQASVPFASQAASLVFVSPFAVRSFFIAIPEGSLALSAQGGFETVSTTFIADHKTFRQFAKLDLQPNTPFTLSMTMLPTANSGQASPLPGLPVLNSYGQNQADAEAVINLMLAIMILAVGIVSIRRSGQTRRRVSPMHDVGKRDLEKTKRDIMDRWLDLERQYQAGEIKSEYYQKQRTQLKDKAIDVELSLRADRG